MIRNFCLYWSDFSNLYKRIKLLVSEYLEKKELEDDMINNNNENNNADLANTKHVKFGLQDSPKCKIKDF